MHHDKSTICVWVALTLAWLGGCAASGTKSPRSTATEEPLIVVTYNIKHGHGMDGAVDLIRIAEVLRPLDADVILLQEVDEGCARSGEVDQAQWLGATLGMGAHFAPFRPFDGGRYGMAALSHLPVTGIEVVELPPGPNPLAAIELKLEYGGRTITVVGLHLVMTEAQRLTQGRFLAAKYGSQSAPWIWAGDLNSEPHSPVLKELSQHAELAASDGDSLTFPSETPTKEIDYVLLGPRGAWEIVSHRVVPEALASDHRPVVVEALLKETRSAR